MKDENGEVGFVPRSVPLARQVGAARDYYEARAAAKLIHARGLYLIGRVVVFEDPVLSLGRPDLAARRGDGSVWRDAAGLGWTNPYDRSVWKYNVDIAVAAARAGFDEILFDYVRFPSDGDVDAAVYRNPRATGEGRRRAGVPALRLAAAAAARRSASRPPSSGSPLRETSASGSSRGAWLLISTTCTR